VREVVRENARSATLVLDVPGWPGHRAGQHLDVRLTAEDGYVAQRSYSIASAPEQETVAITIDRIEDGEVSPYLVEDVLVADELEVRGPIGGPFTWSVDDGGPLVLLGGGSGMVPLVAMLRHRAARGATVPARALFSVRSPAVALFRPELDALEPAEGLDVRWTFTRVAPPGWDGWTSRLDGPMVAEVAGTADATGGDAIRAFVCGPTPFVETAAGLLLDLGHDPGRIRTERFGPS
jgi:ferredoxin-NADP reductase